MEHSFWKIIWDYLAKLNVCTLWLGEFITIYFETMQSKFSSHQLKCGSLNCNVRNTNHSLDFKETTLGKDDVNG